MKSMRRVRCAVAAAVATAAVAACGSTAQVTTGNADGLAGPATGGLTGGSAGNGAELGVTTGAGPMGGSAGTGISAPTGPRSTAATGRAGVGGPAVTSSNTAPLPSPGAAARGVTATTIKIGFIGVDQAGISDVNNQFGGNIKATDPRQQVAAVVKYVNEHGGVAGRKVIPVIAIRDPSSGDPNHGESICQKLTQDDKVFAVVTNAAMDAQKCYVKHQTLLLNDGLESEPTALRPFAPYVWVPGLPTVEAAYAAYVDGLRGQGYFAKGAKVGILGREGAATRSAYNTVVVPALKRLGFPPTEVFWISEQAQNSNTDFAAAAQAAELRFKSKGITHVMFMAPGGSAPQYFMTSAQQQGYFPRYGLSSFDQPGFFLEPTVPATQLRGSVGAGFNQITDVDAASGDPYPTGQAETQCFEAMKSNGDTPPNARAAAFGAEFFCDGLFMLQAAARTLRDNLSVATWTEAASRLGTSYQATYSLPGGTRFVPGQRAGGAFYRYLAYVDTCACFRYTSGNKLIPQP
jgi:ABC-type branched-subunit amino acid transport system substrate-binding protein